MDPTGKHIAAFAKDCYEELESWYPVYRFRDVCAKVTAVGRGTSGYTSKNGYPVTPDTTAENVDSSDFDAVIIPSGGYAPDRMRRHKAMVDLACDVFARGKAHGVICHGGWMLVSANVLRGRWQIR